MKIKAIILSLLLLTSCETDPPVKYVKDDPSKIKYVAPNTNSFELNSPKIQFPKPENQFSSVELKKTTKDIIKEKEIDKEINQKRIQENEEYREVQKEKILERVAALLIGFLLGIFYQKKDKKSKQV